MRRHFAGLAAGLSGRSRRKMAVARASHDRAALLLLVVVLLLCAAGPWAGADELGLARPNLRSGRLLQDARVCDTQEKRDCRDACFERNLCVGAKSGECFNVSYNRLAAATTAPLKGRRRKGRISFESAVLQLPPATPHHISSPVPLVPMSSPTLSSPAPPPTSPPTPPSFGWAVLPRSVLQIRGGLERSWLRGRGCHRRPHHHHHGLGHRHRHGHRGTAGGR